jgi:hypothetical protein
VSGADCFALIDQPAWRELAPLDDRADVLAISPPAEASWQRRLRAATCSAKPLGSNEFVAEIEARAKRELRRGRPGPKRRKQQQS